MSSRERGAVDYLDQKAVAERQLHMGIWAEKPAHTGQKLNAVAPRYQNVIKHLLLIGEVQFRAIF
jgi:hypothetical protein